MLTPDMIAKRQRWANEHANDPWCTTVMMDSTVITYRSPCSPAYGQWGPPYEHFEQHQLGSQLHVYAGASPRGLSASHECTGSTGVHLPYTYSRGKRQGERREGVGAGEAKDVLAGIAKETTPRLVQMERPTLYVMLDRATPHTSTSVQNFLSSSGFHDNLLPAPGCDVIYIGWIGLCGHS